MRREPAASSVKPFSCRQLREWNFIVNLKDEQALVVKNTHSVFEFALPSFQFSCLGLGGSGFRFESVDFVVLRNDMLSLLEFTREVCLSGLVLWSRSRASADASVMVEPVL